MNRKDKYFLVCKRILTIYILYIKYGNRADKDRAYMSGAAARTGDLRKECNVKKEKR